MESTQLAVYRQKQKFGPIDGLVLALAQKFSMLLKKQCFQAFIVITNLVITELEKLKMKIIANKIFIQCSFLEKNTSIGVLSQIVKNHTS
jgi:rRNA-processing protein FCF1